MVGIAGESALAAIERIADSGLPAQQLLEGAAARIDRVVPADAQFLAATDPSTILAMGAGLVRDLPLELCQVHWDYEFMVPDFNKFVDIAQRSRLVADLHEATRGRPARSPRWRVVASHMGKHAEVRMVFAQGGAVWGIGQLSRFGSSTRFDEDEKSWLARVAPVLARGLRRAVLAQTGMGGAGKPEQPGVVLLDADGRVESMNGAAAELLEEISPGASFRGSAHPVPFEAFSAAARARADRPRSDRHGAEYLRLRARDGTWLTMHATPLADSDQIAVIIERARTSDIAALIVEAYGLTARERDITWRLARGLGTARIAAALYLSQHTVRDHIKAIFEKVGVHSRGELVAQIFADHYAPPSHFHGPATPSTAS